MHPSSRFLPWPIVLLLILLCGLGPTRAEGHGHGGGHGHHAAHYHGSGGGSPYARYYGRRGINPSASAPGYFVPTWPFRRNSGVLLPDDLPAARVHRFLAHVMGRP
jgi:hypothetical protein